MGSQTTGTVFPIPRSSEKYWEIKNQTDTSAELYLYSAISSWGAEWGDTSAKDVINAVKALGNISQLNICINSPGGTVSEGMAIKAFLARQTFKKDVYIDGLCASIATAIAFGIGAAVHMESTALVMIHNAWTYAYGNAAELRKAADDLEKHDATIKQIYLERTAGTISEDEIADMMASETWLSASECLEYGFIDEIVSGSTQAAACMPKEYFDLYKNVPKGVSVLNENPEIHSNVTAAQAIIDKANAALQEYSYRKEKNIYGR
ncbi:MAG: Clp protease ClpP [Oscillospiraceae bacterium]|nr:Clp protease ClpP [Oscillospiraceae bacterium]